MFAVCKHKFTTEHQQKILQLRQLVEANPELEIGTEDILLSKFLNFTDWSVNAAYESICNYYEFKYRHPTWVAQHPVEHFRDHLFYTNSKFLMPQPDKEGRVVVVFKSVDAFDRYPNYFQDMVEMDDLVFEALLLLPKVQKNGLSVILDVRGTTKNFLRMLSPSIARIMNEKNDVLPFKRRVVHLIQKGFFLNAAYSLIMPFISKEFKENIYSHDGKNFKKLREMIGYESLPADYGGPPENILDQRFLYNYLKSNSDYLVKLQSYRKRPADTTTTNTAT